LPSGLNTKTVQTLQLLSGAFRLPVRVLLFPTAAEQVVPGQEAVERQEVQVRLLQEGLELV